MVLIATRRVINIIIIIIIVVIIIITIGMDISATIITGTIISRHTILTRSQRQLCPTVSSRYRR